MNEYLATLMTNSFHSNMDLVQPNISPTLSFSVCIENHLFIVLRGPIIDKEL